MYVIYYCCGGAHSSVTAAAVHTGLLDRDRPPTGAELLALPGFDRVEAEEHGYLRQIGIDGAGHGVYTLGARSAGPVIERALRGLVAAAGLDPRAFVFADTRRAVNGWMRIGRLCSRVPGLRAIGRPLVVYGTRRAFPAIVSLVDRVRAATAGREDSPGVPRPGPAEPRVVYYCYGGVHTSVVAAAIHLGRLPRGRVPAAAAILGLELFDRRRAEPLGTPRWLGRDRHGALVGVLGLGPCRRFAARVIRDALRTLGADPDRVVLVPVLERTGWLVRLGGFLAQRLRWSGVGTRLVAAGIRRAYGDLVAAVREGEEQVARQRRR